MLSSIQLLTTCLVQAGGLDREKSYPYRGTHTGTCDINKENEHAAKITGFGQVPTNSEHDLLKAVAMQPVSIGIAAYGDDFRHYKTGMFSSSDCGTHLNHSVTAVGYGASKAGSSYWLMKKSWGKDWGENGYMRIRRNSGSPEGMCGLAKKSFYPIA